MQINGQSIFTNNISDTLKLNIFSKMYNIFSLIEFIFFVKSTDIAVHKSHLIIFYAL